MVRIAKVRLICFHNFVDETIEVDGHLFLVGSNGSGKTTVLDAIHYVLTGGELELNAAARIAGRKDEGRNAGDIVLRMNHNTGPMRPQGGISYAALELQEGDSRYTIGVGLRKDGPVQAHQSWGFIIDEPLADHFFVDADRKLLDFAQLRSAQGPAKVFGRIGAYRDEICRRFFGGRENLANLCRILNTAKSYREMVSKSMQYEELFKSLLPPPPEEVLTDFLAALQRLEDDRQEELKWKRRCEYLEQLAGARDKLIECEEKRDVADAMLVELEIRQLDDDMSDQRLKRRQAEEDLTRIGEEILRKDEQLSGLRAKVADLQGQDADGLLRRRDALREECREKTSRASRLQGDVDEQQRIVADLDAAANRADTAIRDRAKQILTAANRLQVEFDQDCTAPARELGELLQTDGLINRRLTCTAALTDACRRLCADREQSIRARETAVEQMQAEIDELEQRLAALRENPRIRPLGIYEFDDVQDEIAINTIKAEPLYRLIEWRDDVELDLRAGLEQLIGEEVLATFLVSPPQYDKARKLLHSQYFGIRLARWETSKQALPDWVHRYFDPAASDPAALCVLAEEMSSSAEPALLLEDDYILASFRSHSAGFARTEPRLIGEAHRLEQIQREIAAAEADLRELAADMKTSRKELRHAKQSLGELNAIHTDLCRLDAELTPLFDDLLTTAARLQAERRRLDERTQLLEEARAALKDLQQALAAIEASIAEKGINTLKTEISRLQDAIQAGEAERDDLQRRRGAAENELAAARARLDQLQVDRDALQQQLDQRRDQLAARISAERRDQLHAELAEHMSSLRTITRARDKYNEFAVTQRTHLQDWIRDPNYSHIYDFSFDEATRGIFTRNGQSLDDAHAEAAANYERTSRLLEEKNRETIQRIFGGSMVNVLYRNMSELSDMVRLMSRKLDGRIFGDTAYNFRIRPKDEYRHIVEGIKELHSLSPDKDRILNHLYDEMKHAAREMVGAVVPERLDYRSWYDYELHMKVGDGEKRLTNRVRKSGSGGEQAVPNYILILAAAHFFYSTYKTRMRPLLFDEGFYGIDAARQDQLLAFAADLGLQLIVATPDVDGTGKEIEKSTTAFLQKDMHNDVLVECFYWDNPAQPDLGWTPDQLVRKAD